MVNRRSSTFLLLLRFFGLSNEYRFQLFKVIHDICYYGNGGYDFLTVYNMPIWLRKLTFNFIADQRQKESDAYTKASKGKNNIDFADPKSAKQKLQASNQPTYSTKASRK